MASYINFPKYKSYPSVLQIGFKSYEPKIVVGKKILVVLDTTGSMGEMINWDREGTKITFAKNIISKIVEAYPFSVVEVMPFSDKPKAIVSVSQIPDPNGGTYFSPILPVIKNVVKSDSEYATVIFMSDGLPSESKQLALDSIRQIGVHCREINSNTISVAIGSDADGQACSLFTGNRGYNCFVKFKKDIDPALTDIINGIKCNFVQISDGNWIPIEENGHYYYLGNDTTGQSATPNIDNVRKYVSLIIQEELQNPDSLNEDSLIKFIQSVASVLQTPDKNEIIEFFTKSLTVVKKTIIANVGTNSIMSVAKQAYQTMSPSAGI